ncbi:MAG: universal stress protein [Rhizomicrobium sp.]|jgi:nucleotide-binding universal stress UspA family protein
MSFQRVLIAVDRGSQSSRAVDVALELAASLKADVSIIHVMVPPVIYGTPSGLPKSEMMALAREEGFNLLAELRQNPALPHLAHEFLETGDPATEIVKAAKEWPADVIVMGSHGREGVARVVLGSVAESVIRQAPCPVLVVRIGV